MHNDTKGFPERLKIVASRLGTRQQAADIGGITLDALIRQLRGDNQPGFHTISRLCQAAGVSMHWLATGEGSEELTDLTLPSSIQGLPVAGFAETKEPGWYQAQPSRMQTTLDLPDPKAFATVVNGQALIPEGIHPGFMCICSPMMKAVIGDIIHLRRKDGLCALRLFQGEEKGWLLLKAYTDADSKGQQRAYEDKVKSSVIEEIAPVVFIKRKV